MTTPVEIVRSFYAKLATLDLPGALSLMAPDIEWNTMWHYKAAGRGPEHVAEGVLKPFAAEWTTGVFVPAKYVAVVETVVSIGDFTGVHGVTGKTVEARYAHAWIVRDGKITQFDQFIDTLAISEARKS
jgi:ketosteroid isomerase-like protein